MRALDRKLLRDLGHMKGQAIAICLVLASGIATFVMSLTTLQSLRDSQSAYYERSRFAHAFAHMKRAPQSLAARIADIPGVMHVQTRVVADVNLDVPGLDEPAVGRLISVPDAHPPELNKLYLRSGRYILPGRSGEVLVSEAFATSRKLREGDSLRAIINGRYQELHIVGIALSPEYILQIRSGEAVPDDTRFGVFWMGYEQLASAFNMDGAFNDVTLTLMRSANEQEVLKQLDALIEPYGGIGSYGRRDQPSYFFLTSEISALRGMGLIVPSIFLGVAAFLLNVVMNRVISTQREQIAGLKAFGYSNREIGWHYIKLVIAISLIGAAMGIALGAWLGKGLTGIYSQFYKFPVFQYGLDGQVLAMAIFFAVGAAVAGTLFAVRKAVSLPAAEAMRPEPPANYKPTVAERLGLQRLLSQSTRMMLRHIERRPLKAALSVLGISLAVSVLVLGNFLTDSLDYLMEFAFYTAQRQDMSLNFTEPTTGKVMHDVQRLPGVMQVEPFRGVPARIRFANRSRRVGVLGLTPGGDLNRVVNSDGTTLTLPEEGIALSAMLGENLGAKVGDRITLEIMEGRRPVVQQTVVALMDDFSGTGVYMHISAVRRMMMEGDTVTGAFITVDQKHAQELYRRLKQTPRVADVTVQASVVQAFMDTQAENQKRIQSFNIIFAAVIAFGVVYNTARISLGEHSRELATLRVIGFTRREISAILLGELAVLTLAALPVGMLLGRFFASLVGKAFESEMWRLPMIVTRQTYALAAAVTLAASIISGLVVRRKLDHLDLIAVLKSKE